MKADELMESGNEEERKREGEAMEKLLPSAAELLARPAEEPLFLDDPRLEREVVLGIVEELRTHPEKLGNAGVYLRRSSFAARNSFARLVLGSAASSSSVLADRVSVLIERGDPLGIVPTICAEDKIQEVLENEGVLPERGGDSERDEVEFLYLCEERFRSLGFDASREERELNNRLRDLEELG